MLAKAEQDLFIEMIKGMETQLRNAEATPAENNLPSAFAPREDDVLGRWRAGLCHCGSGCGR